MPKTNFCRGQRPLLSQVLVKLGNQPIDVVIQIRLLIIGKMEVNSLKVISDLKMAIKIFYVIEWCQSEPISKEESDGKPSRYTKSTKGLTNSPLTFPLKRPRAFFISQLTLNIF